jgi:hypothetical protein
MMRAVDEDRQLADFLNNEVASWDNDRPRSQQVTLGPSELGGCREYIRATVAGDPGLPETGFKAAAFMGTAVGDLIERVFGERLGAILQREVHIQMGRTGITVAGSADAIIPAQVIEIPDSPVKVILQGGMVVDIKSKDGLAEIEKYGASMENLIQISVYLVGAVAEGLLSKSSYGVLLYVDRSGGTKRFATVTIDYDEATRWIDLAEERLMDVDEVLEKGSPEEDRWALRDKSPSWCFAVQCPFRENCWGGSEHRPTGQITHPDELEAVARYVAARDLEKQAAELKAAANKSLAGVAGITPDGTTVSWTSTGRRDPTGEPAMRLDVRVVR